MNIKEAARAVYGESVAETVYGNDTLRIRRRELESEAEAERMAIKSFESEAYTWLQKSVRAKKRLEAINDELRELGALLP